MVPADQDKEPVASPQAGLGGGSAASGGADYYAFILQTVLDIKGSVGELKTSVQLLKESVEKTESSLVRSIEKMDSKVENLIGWKNKIFGGAMVAGAIIAALSFLIGKAWEYVTVTAPIHQLQQQQPAQPPPAQPAAPSVAPPAPVKSK